MTAKDYIINKIKKLNDISQDIYTKYAYDNTTDYHIIEVSPETIRRGNDAYMNWENEFWNEFYKNFPYEDILITEPSKFNNMDNILYKKLPKIWLNSDTKGLAIINTKKFAFSHCSCDKQILPYKKAESYYILKSKEHLNKAA